MTLGVEPPRRVAEYCCVCPGVSVTWRGDMSSPVNPVAVFEYGPSVPAASIARTR